MQWKTVAAIVLPVLAALGVLGPQANLLAQRKQSTQEELIKKRDEKFALPVFKKADWTFDYDVARETAKKTGKPIFAYFSRSYVACRPCTALENEAFSDAEFAEFGKQAVLFCHMTTDVEGDKYPTLLFEKGGSSFPYLVFMDAEGNVIAKQGDRSVKGFQKSLQAIGAVAALEKKFAAGDKSVGVDLLVASAELGTLDLAGAKAKVAAIGKLTPEQQKKVDGLLLDLEVTELWTGVRTQADAVELGRKFWAMWEAGKVPTGRPARNFSAMILIAKEADKDVPGFEKALAAYKELLKDEPYAAPVLKRFDDTLEKLKSGG